MKKFTPEYYDSKYFADEKGIEFTLPNGRKEYWGYLNPKGEFLGAQEITEAWKKMFTPDKMLDVGAGRGTVIAYARDAGIDAVGFDFSEWAVGDEGRYEKCNKEWLIQHDATEKWPYEDNSFPLVIALDFCEHIYDDDIDFVISEMFRVSSKWVFLLIATVDGIKETGYHLKKGEDIPWEDGRTWAGHVTVDTEEWWIERFYRDDVFLRRDMVNWFVSLVNPSILTNWLQNSILIMESE